MQQASAYLEVYYKLSCLYWADSLPKAINEAWVSWLALTSLCGHGFESMKLKQQIEQDEKHLAFMQVHVGRCQKQDQAISLARN